MPIYYDPSVPKLPTEKISGRDLAFKMDIGGDQKIKDLRPDEQLFANMGSAITDTVGTGISIASKIPGVKEAAGFIAESPIGAVLGTAMDIANIPSNIIGTAAAYARMKLGGTGALPTDIQNMIASGKSEWDIVQYMVNTQRAWSNSQEANLIFSLLTDPLTYLSAGTAKIGMLKPIAGLAGAAGGAVAGGALAGTMALGPVGTVGGAILGGVKASRKAAQFAAKALEKGEALQRVAARVDDAAKAGKTLATAADEVAQIGGELTSAEKMAIYLNKPRGLDLAKRLSIGRQAQAELSRLEKVKLAAEKAGDAEAIKIADEGISNAKFAMEEANAIDEGVLYGVYSAYKDMSRVVGGKASMIGAAMTVPATQWMHRRLGGFKLNERVADFTGIFPTGVVDPIKERIGRGIANFGIIGMQNVVNGSNKYKAINAAEQLAKLYFDARADLLRIRKAEGAATKLNADEIISQMRTNVQASAARTGGQTGVVGMFDTGNVDELRRRIDYLTTLDEQAAKLTPGRGTVPQIKALAAYIESNMNISDVQAVRNAGGTFEKTLVQRMKEAGPEEFSRAGIDEINNQQEVLTVELGNRASAYTMAKAHTQSVAAAHGIRWEEVSKQFDEFFEKRFGKLYDSNGLVKSSDSAMQAADEMLIIQSTGYASATETAGRYNALVDGVLAGDPEVVARLGQDSVDSLKKLFSQTGKIHIVGRNHMFYDKVVAFTRSYAAIQSITKSLEEAAQKAGEAPVTGSLLEDGAPVLTASRAGNSASVTILRRQLRNLIQAASGEGDEYVRTLRALDSQLTKAKDLNDARKMWSAMAMKNIDDVRMFGSLKGHEEIYDFLVEAERQGLTVRRVPQATLDRVVQGLKLIGFDDNVIAGITGGAYRVVDMPKSNKIYKPALLDTPNLSAEQRRIIGSKVVPFVDMGDAGIVKVGNKMVKTPTYTANYMQDLGAKLFSPIPQKYVTASVRRRLGSYLARGGVTQAHVDAILDELVQRGIAQGVSARGISTQQQYEAIRAGIERIGGPGSYQAFLDSFRANTLDKVTEFNPTKAVMYAFQGDRNVVGASQYFTGGLKTWAPSIAKFTDDLYPTIKFKANPLYYLQEWFESPTLNTARGVDTNVVSSISRDGEISNVTGAQLRNLVDVGPETQSYLDNVNFLAVFRNDAVAQAMTGRYDDVVAATGAWENIKRGRGLTKLAQAKEAARDALALDITAKTFSDTLRERDFGMWSALSKHYGTTDARSMFTNYAHYRMRLGDERRVLSDIEASRPAGVGFNRIPDPSGDVRFAARRELITGGRYASEEQVLGQGFGALSQEELRQIYTTNPHLHRAELDKHLISLEDAGYDMTRLTPAGQKLRNAITKLENDLRSGNGIAAESIQAIDEARGELASALDKLDEESILLLHKQSAMRTLANATGFIDPNNLDELSDQVIQTLLVGKGFSIEGQNVIDAVNRSIIEARRLGIDPKNGVAFSEAVSNAMLKQISANPRLGDAFGRTAMEIVGKRGAEETVYNAFQYAYMKALEQANKTTFFSPDRSFFERTINHPMLGFYPYSYMFKKILPEMIEFLFKKPFGAQAPLAGYAAYMKVRDYVEAQIEQDPSFRRALESKSEVMYMMTMMFPGVPWDVSVVPPAWARNVYKRIRTDKDITPQNILLDDLYRSVESMGVLAAVPLAGSAVSQAFEDSGVKPVKRIQSSFPEELQ